MTTDFYAFKYFFSEEELVDKVFLLNNAKVMLDTDIALLFNESIKYLRFITTSNINNFAINSLFRLKKSEKDFIVSQSNSSTSKITKYAFTETGVLTLVSKLKNDRAIKTHIKYINDIIKIKIIKFLKTPGELYY